MAAVILICFRDRVPVRSTVPARANFRDYKGQLRDDFNLRCGYCDSVDIYFGGTRGAQIDHFAPKSKFPALTNQYSNLVYSCPICNRAKWDKWLGNDPTVSNNGEQGFVDPCCTDFDRHLARRNSGEIVPRTRLGEYMVQHLNLRLQRHKFIWQVEKLDSLVARLLELKPLVERSSPRYTELLEAIPDLVAMYREYRHHAYAE